MKTTEKASPIINPRIVALVNRPFTQYRTRIPTFPSGLATLIVDSGPRPSPQSTARIRLPVSHRSQYSPHAEDSQCLRPRRSSHDLLSQSVHHAPEPHPDHEQTISSLRP